MNIILVFTFDISLKSWKDSGLLEREIYLYEQMSLKHNITYTFITYGDESDSYIVQNENINVIPIYKFIKKSKSQYLNFLKTFMFTRKIKNELKNIDIIKTNQLSGSWVGLILKFILKKPLIIRTGYNLYEFSLQEKKNILIRSFHYHLTNLSLKYSDIYTVSSFADKKFLNERFNFDSEIQVIPNWVRQLNSESFEKRYSKKILAVGRLENQKNFESLIKDLSKTKIEIDIVGDGSKKEDLANLAKELDINVNFLGKLSYKDLEKLYRKYRVLVNSSNFEGNSKVILEAMANGCSVVARKNKNNIEIVEDKINGFTYTNVDELTEILNKLMNDVNVFNNITKNAHKSIKKNNLIETTISKEINNYEKLIDF
tara:strand:+ start:2595 stop:3710 length:1116 start_codon:yes stop_codon:yes gene_type:complete